MTFPEPVDKWTNLNGTDILGLMYNDPERWAMLHVSWVPTSLYVRYVNVAPTDDLFRRLTC